MRWPAPGAFVTTLPSTGDCAGPAGTTPPVSVSPLCCGGSVEDLDSELAIVSGGTVTVLDRYLCSCVPGSPWIVVVRLLRRKGSATVPPLTVTECSVGDASSQKSVLLSVTLTPIRCPARTFQSADQRSSGIRPLA